MDKVFKKKTDIPPPPKLPAPSHIVEDLKAAPADDPVFYETSISQEVTKGDDNFRVAKDFMTTTSKLKELEELFELQKSHLEKSYQELQIMSENIRQQATEALSSIY